MANNTLDFTINGDHSMDIKAGVHGSFSQSAAPILSADRTISVVSEYGDMLFQELECSFGSIWINRYDMKRKAVLSAESPHPSLEVMHMLSGNISFSPQGLPLSLTMQDKNWQMIHLPHTANRVEFAAGTKLTTLDIHYNLAFLEKLAVSFPELDRFLALVHAGRPASFAAHSVPIPRDVMLHIGGLLAERNADARNLHLFAERHMVDWTAGNLESPFLAGTDLKATPADIKMIADLIEVILADVKFPHTLSSLARLAGINEYKLKYTFKAVTGMPPHQFLVSERMKKALGLLQDPLLSMDDIADECGYESYAGFSKEFKKKYGFPPSFFRGKKFT